MDGEPAQFPRVIEAIVRRYFGQNGEPPPPAANIVDFTVRLRALIAERGLPRPLQPDEVGAPGELPEAETAPLVARVLPEGAPRLFSELAKQLVKACFYPEFKVCRDSFCAATSEGACRRQELARVRKRVSGTHCVDCPYWVALDAEAHAGFLLQHWRQDAAVFEANRSVFLPEDFRALRAWLHAAAREQARR